MEKTLEYFGLTENEAKVYLALIKQGSSQIGKIAKRTGIHRRTVYDAIERLIGKGFVSYIKANKINNFEAVDPSRLLDVIKEKEENIKVVLVELQKIYNSIKNKKETLFFRGKEAIKSAFDDQINVGKEILFMGKGVNVNEIVKFYFPRFDSKRIKKNIPIKMLFDSNAKNITEIKNIPLSEIKFINALHSSPMSIYIYGENTSIVLWNDDPLAILIREKEIAEGFREHFNILWEMAKHH